MSLIISTGSNLGNKEENLSLALDMLRKQFQLIASSRIYKSRACYYVDQPDFLNQVLEFKNPSISPETIMLQLLDIEKQLGRSRTIPKGPRIIDLDILFIGIDCYSSGIVTIPHPRLFERSFAVFPLKELPYYRELQEHFSFPDNFSELAHPIT